MNILSNMFIRQISTLIILFVYYQFIKPFRVKPSYILKSFLYLGLTVIYGVASCFFDQFEPQKYTLFCWNTNIYFTASYLVVELFNFVVFIYYICNLRTKILLLAKNLKSDALITYSKKLVNLQFYL